MTGFQALILGLVQGLTEFLPVSSTAHLVVAQNFFNLTEAPVEFDIILHLATALATVIVFWSTIKQINLQLIKFIVLATIPTGILGLFFRHWDKLIFGSLLFSAITLIINGLILLLPRFLTPKPKINLNQKNSILIGIAQGLAVLPGISRSGSTIVAGLLSGLKPAEAYNFSFIISLPAIVAAVLLSLKDVNNFLIDPSFIFGFIAAFFSGILALKILKRIVSRGNLTPFAVYCLILGMLLL